jgi:hypothetical protein
VRSDRATMPFNATADPVEEFVPDIRLELFDS